MSDKKEKQDFSWYYKFLIGILRLLIYLPYPFLIKLGKGIGILIYYFSKKARAITFVNIQLCFPELSLAEQKNLVIHNFESLGISLIEMILAWWGKKEKLQSLLQIQGMEYLEEAIAKGKGVILCSAHFMSLELVGRLLANKLSFAVVYRPQKNAYMNKLARECRERIYAKIISRGDLRGMLKYLKMNGIVWYTPDIDAGLQNSVFVPFFNIATATITATSRLIEHSQAEILPTFLYRRADGQGYDIIIHPPIENYPSGNIEEDAANVNKIIETAIRQAPEQYLWQYKRFKTRPNAEARFYD
ncbi:MAG: Lipid A biosynthesis lauroyltransferase [Legionellaceae bacterium]